MKENKDKDNKLFGVASLFDKEQLRTSFVNYLYIIVGLELIIFVVMLVASVGLAKEPFPWKSYLFITFTVPVAITFLFGIFVLAFNYFFFGHRPDVNTETISKNKPENAKSYLLKTNSLIDSMRKLPIMLTLFIIIVGSLATYKLNDVLMVIINTSEQLVKYLFIAMGMLLLVGTLLALTWLIINYKLRKKHMDYQNKYRHAAMEHLGLLIIEDQTAIDHNNVVITPSHSQHKEDQGKQKGLMILPPTGKL